MRILDKYLIKQFILPFLYCVLIFISLYVVIDLFDHLDEILKERVEPAVLGRYYLSFVPLIFVQTAPIALLLSIIYSLGILNRYNEIIAMRTNGISILRIITPFIIVGLILSLINFVISDKIIPKSSVIQESIKQEKMKRGPGKKVVLADVTAYGVPNRLIYIKSYNVTQEELSDITIFEQDKKGIIRSKIIASRAKWQGKNWIFYNVTIYNLDNDGQIIGAPSSYEEKALDIREGPEDFQKQQTDPMFMSYRKLKHDIDRLEWIGKQKTKRMLVDLYCKLSFPFVNLIIILVGIPLALAIKAKGGLLMGLGLSMAVGFLYYAVMAVSVALGKGGFIPPLLSAWLANIIFAGIAVVALKKI
ncbi:MAG: LptF/LptG family permease [Candidatus Omnitrophota bacterium]|nr:LptF/LptG family permease [Candidatus Omnitrophota bacterium]